MSKPSITNCPNTFFGKVHSFNCIFSSLSCFACVQIRHPPLSGGYCGGVPPLPIPNREVKPTCADGTAMQCGRVGNRLLSVRASRTKVFGALFVYIHFITSYTLLYIYILLYIRLYPFTLLPFYLFTFLLFYLFTFLSFYSFSLFSQYFRFIFVYILCSGQTEYDR